MPANSTRSRRPSDRSQTPAIMATAKFQKQAMMAQEFIAPGQPDADPAVLADLRLRLQGSQTQETAARAEARRLAHELALARRLLKFSFDGPAPVRTAAAADGRRLSTALLTGKMVYHLDVCERRGTHTVIAGWAFCPLAGWDARFATVTLILRHDDIAYMTGGGSVPRPDIAAHYAAQPAGASGGARGLEGAGFSCEILHDSLPADTEWKVVLRLDCDGLACEQFTGRRLRF